MVRRIVRFASACALAGALTAGPVSAAQTPLRVGANLSGLVMAYHDPRSGAPVGFDIDLIRAIGAKLGVPVEIRDHAFDDLFKAVKDGTFDVAISGITDTRARERIDDFVDYLLVGSGIIVQRGNPKRIFSFDSLCGHSFAVEAGTTQQAAAEKASANCKALGLRGVTILTFASDDTAFAAFQSGKADVESTDFPVLAYRARISGGRYEVVGRQIDVQPYGIAVAKTHRALRDRIAHALAALIADGTYDRLLQKWGLQPTAMRSAPVNAGTLFEK
jgi:polar amino acid transport system substrate-binding protein